jgi:CRP/FNR family transcriptional regulator, cyclic AMP receptor protein
MIKVTPAALAAQPFLRGLASGQLERLAETASDVTMAARYRIFEEGGYATGFWLIRCGRVTLDLHVPGQGPVAIETLRAGDILGWSWFLPPYRWGFGAVTVGPGEAFQFGGPAVRALLDADPELGYELTRRFLAVASNRLQAARIRLLDVSVPPEARASL